MSGKRMMFNSIVNFVVPVMGFGRLQSEAVL